MVLHYIHYLSNIDMGFTFGAYEDHPKIGFVDRLFQRIGLFLIRREPRNSLYSRDPGDKVDSEITNYINQALFQDVLENNQITTLFQNDERIRSGKFSYPIHPDKSIKILLKSV